MNILEEIKNLTNRHYITKKDIENLDYNSAVFDPASGYHTVDNNFNFLSPFIYNIDIKQSGTKNVLVNRYLDYAYSNTLPQNYFDSYISFEINNSNSNINLLKDFLISDYNNSLNNPEQIYNKICNEYNNLLALKSYSHRDITNSTNIISFRYFSLSDYASSFLRIPLYYNVNDDKRYNFFYYDGFLLEYTFSTNENFSSYLEENFSKYNILYVDIHTLYKQFLDQNGNEVNKVVSISREIIQGVYEVIFDVRLYKQQIKMQASQFERFYINRLNLRNLFYTPYNYDYEIFSSTEYYYQTIRSLDFENRDKKTKETLELTDINNLIASLFDTRDLSMINEYYELMNNDINLLGFDESSEDSDSSDDDDTELQDSNIQDGGGGGTSSGSGGTNQSNTSNTGTNQDNTGTNQDNTGTNNTGGSNTSNPTANSDSSVNNNSNTENVSNNNINNLTNTSGTGGGQQNNSECPDIDINNLSNLSLEEIKDLLKFPKININNLFPTVNNFSSLSDIIRGSISSNIGSYTQLSPNEIKELLKKGINKLDVKDVVRLLLAGVPLGALSLLGLNVQMIRDTIIMLRQELSIDNLCDLINLLSGSNLPNASFPKFPRNLKRLAIRMPKLSLKFNLPKIPIPPPPVFSMPLPIPIPPKLPIPDIKTFLLALLPLPGLLCDISKAGDSNCFSETLSLGGEDVLGTGNNETGGTGTGTGSGAGAGGTGTGSGTGGTGTGTGSGAGAGGTGTGTGTGGTGTGTGSAVTGSSRPTQGTTDEQDEPPPNSDTINAINSLFDNDLLDNNFINKNIDNIRKFLELYNKMKNLLAKYRRFFNSKHILNKKSENYRLEHRVQYYSPIIFLEKKSLSVNCKNYFVEFFYPFFVERYYLDRKIKEGEHPLKRVSRQKHIVFPQSYYADAFRTYSVEYYKINVTDITYLEIYPRIIICHDKYGDIEKIEGGVEFTKIKFFTYDNEDKINYCKVVS